MHSSSNLPDNGDRRASLQIRLLGPMEVAGPDGVLLAIPLRKARLLLAFLAVNAGRSESRERLASLFWSDRSDEQARASLRQALATLRAAIGEIGSDLIRFTTGGVRCAAEGLITDVGEFERAARSMDLEGVGPLSTRYRGELLAGEIIREPLFADWLSAERERTKALATSVIQKLCDALLSKGDANAAIDAGHSLMHVDPLREDSHRLLIRALAQSGDRSGALSQYLRLCRTLERELGVTPDAETESLIRQIRAPNPRRPALRSGRDEAVASALPGFRSSATILVMPFKDTGFEAASPYLVDGLTEDIIDGLSAWRWMPIIGRATSMHYKNAKANPLAIAAELGANYVVAGTLRRSADDLQLAIELISAANGQQIWNTRITKPIGDLFTIQEHLTRTIVACIEPEILRSEYQYAVCKGPTDLTAWDHILRARHAKSSSGPGYGTEYGNAQAAEQLDRAIELDPTSSQAQALLAECYWHAAIHGWSMKSNQPMDTALALAQRAVELDDRNWMAFAYRGLLRLFGSSRMTGVLADSERAVELNPSSSLARHCYGCSLGFGGNPELSLMELEVALQLDPRYSNRATILADMSLDHLLLGRLDDAVLYAGQSVAEQPNYIRGYHRLVAALSVADRMEEAAAALAHLRELQPHIGLNYIRETYPFVRPQDRAIFENAFERIGIA